MHPANEWMWTPDFGTLQFDSGDIIDTGVKQSEHTIFHHVIKIVIASKCIFEETLPKLSVNFGNIVHLL